MCAIYVGNSGVGVGDVYCPSAAVVCIREIDSRAIRAIEISADAEATHQSVVRAMDAAGQMGFVHLSITTRQPASQGGG